MTTVFTDKERIKSLLSPEKYSNVPEFVLPTSRRLVATYANEEKRGYLANYAKDTSREHVFEKILKETKIQWKFPKNSQ